MAAVARRTDEMMVATQEAFDAVSVDYDHDNRSNVLLEAMRARSLQALAAHVPAGSHVLDLGCGPGTDFEALAALGYRVTAVESSDGMAEQARRRATQLRRRRGEIDVLHGAIEQIDRLAPATYDAAYSNFGPFNCVADLDQAAAAVAARLRRGGVLVASVIGRLCPWEIACYAWKRNGRRVAVRFSRDFVPVPLGSHTIWTRYYSPREFERSFLGAGFVRVSLRTLGLLVPPPYMHAAAVRHRRLTAFLQTVEDRIGMWPVVRACGDHFLIVLRRT